jgi:3'(2'), 5'-bisphosphate nucleotidase
MPMSERKAAGDKRSHDFLMEALAGERPDDAVLSEEGADDPVRLRSERVWIVDPLDGTREFSELGRDDWAVHVALWQAGELVAGAVALPAQGITLATPQVDAPPAAPGKPRIVVSRTRHPSYRLAVRDALTASCGMGLPEPRWRHRARFVDVYVHAGGQSNGLGAPVAVARAGLHTSVRRPPLRITSRPYAADLVVCRPELADAVLRGHRLTSDLAADEDSRRCVV